MTISLIGAFGPGVLEWLSGSSPDTKRPIGAVRKALRSELPQAFPGVGRLLRRNQLIDRNANRLGDTFTIRRIGAEEVTELPLLNMARNL